MMINYSIQYLKDLEENIRLDANYYLSEYIENDDILSRCESVKIGDPRISVLVTDGDHGYPEYSSEGVYYIKAKELTKYGIDYSICEKVSFEYANKLGKRCLLDSEDVILSTVGTIGNVYLVKETIPHSVLSRDIAKIVVNKNYILPEYMYLFLNSIYGQLQIQRLSTGSIQKGLYIYAINKIKIPLLNMSHQKEFSKRVDKIFIKKRQIDKLKQEMNELLKKDVLELNVNS